MTIHELSCHECGQNTMIEETTARDHKVGKRVVHVPEDRHLRCEKCDAIRYHGPMLDEIQRKIAEIIRKEDGLLTPDELRVVRLKYGLTQAEMENLLSIGPKTWTRWERGKVVQTAAADRLIRVIARNPDALRDLLAERGVESASAHQALAEIDADVARELRQWVENQFGHLPAGLLEEMVTKWASKYRDAQHRSASRRAA